jgi:hypothetical protein
MNKNTIGSNDSRINQTEERNTSNTSHLKIEEKNN